MPRFWLTYKERFPVLDRYQECLFHINTHGGTVWPFFVKNNNIVRIFRVFSLPRPLQPP